MWGLASHDLRQPVQGLMLLLKVIESASDESRPAVVARMKSSVESLSAMLELMTLIARLEDGSAVLKTERLDLDGIVAQACAQLSQLTGISIRYHGCGGLAVMGDARLFAAFVLGFIATGLKRAAAAQAQVVLDGDGWLCVQSKAATGWGREAFSNLTGAGAGTDVVTTAGPKVLERLARLIGASIDASAIPERLMVQFAATSGQKVLAKRRRVGAVTGAERSK